MLPPALQCRRRRYGPDAVTERIALVENQLGIRIHVRGAGDLGIDLAIHDGNRPFEDAADDALLTPDLAGQQFAIGVEAGQLGAGSGAAGRAVVGFTGTEHEVLAIGAGSGGFSEELDVIDLAAIRAGDAVGGETPADAPGKIGELVEPFESERLAVVAAEEEPVAAPCDVAIHAANPRRVHGDMHGAAVTGHVADGDAAIVTELSLDDAGRSFEAAHAATDPPEMGQRHHQPDGAVAAHAEVADVVEEDDAGVAGRVGGLAEQGPDDGIVAARFVDHRGAEGVELGAKAFEALGDRARAQIRPSGNYYPGGLAAGVRIDDADAVGHCAARAGRVAMARRITPRTWSRSAPSMGRRGARTISDPSPVSAMASLMY